MVLLPPPRIHRQKTRLTERVHRSGPVDPAAPPKSALDRGFYVAPPIPVVETLVRRLALSPGSTNLLLGHIGGGKTTTLLRARNTLAAEVKAVGDQVFFVDVAERHRL